MAMEHLEVACTQFSRIQRGAPCWLVPGCGHGAPAVTEGRMRTNTCRRQGLPGWDVQSQWTAWLYRSYLELLELQLMVQLRPSKQVRARRLHLFVASRTLRILGKQCRQAPAPSRGTALFTNCRVQTKRGYGMVARG
jgi:hypothetical protein